MPHKHLSIPSHTGQLKGVRDAVLELATPCLHAQAHLVALAVDEALANVILHGLHGLESAFSARPSIDVDIDSDARRVEVRIADRGPEFDPSQLRAPDPARRVQARLRGGMGSGIIRQVMDEIHYARLPGPLNELRLVKYRAAKNALEAPPPAH